MDYTQPAVPTLAKFILPVFSVLAFVGCASVSVQSPQFDATKRLRNKPEILIVKDYSFPKRASVRADREGQELLNFESSLQTSLRQELGKALQHYGLPVKTANTAAELSALRRRQRAWLITGQFTRVNQGSRALRVILGAGAGGTKMETSTEVYDLSTHDRTQPLYSFSTTGGSNAEPGIVTAAGPYAPTTVPAVVLGIALKGAHGVTEDTKRTARVIAAYVSEKLAARGDLPPGQKAGRAKRPGEL